MTTDKAPYSEDDPCWHLVVTTHGGAVSLLRNLDAPLARKTYQKLCYRDAPIDFENSDGDLSFCYTLRDADVVRVDILGPEGAELDPWRGFTPLIIRKGVLR